VSDQNFSAIRARLRYETIEDFVEGYSRFISAGGMFIPMKPSKLKPIGTTIRFQFLLGDGSTALLGEGIVLQVRSPDDQTPNSPVGMLIKFTKLSQESKTLVDHIIETKSAMLKPNGSESQEQRHPTKPFIDEEDPMKTPTPPSFEAAQSSPLSDFLLGDQESEESPEEDEDLQEEAGTQDHSVEYAAEVAQAAAEPEFELDLGLDEPDDPETAEAPALEPETPTAEAPEPEPAADKVSEVIEHAGPKELGRTAGGLQILAFDSLGDDEMKDLENFSFEGEESDIDDMFDGLFGAAASDAVDSMFAGAMSSGPTTKDSMSSVEFELPPESELEDEPEQEPLEEEALEEEALEEEALEEEALEEEALEEEALEEEALEEEALEEDAEDGSLIEGFGFETQSEKPDADESDEFLLSDSIRVEPEGPDDFGSSLPESPEESWSFGGDSQQAPEESEGVALDDDDFEEEKEQQHEIHSLMDHMEDDADGEEEFSLTIGIIEESKANRRVEEPEDSDSLEALLASARKEIEEKSTEEPRGEGDLIDQLMGDDDLPLPPMDAPVFAMPAAPKKKKGFLSKLFDKD